MCKVIPWPHNFDHQKIDWLHGGNLKMMFWIILETDTIEAYLELWIIKHFDERNVQFQVEM